MTSLAGRTVVVTGGNTGIGFGIARAIAAAGADVAIWGRDGAKNVLAADQLRAAGTHIAEFTCDIAEEEEVIAAFAATLDELGKVDTFIANAGVGGSKRFTSMSLAEWRAVTSVNLDGTFLCFREAARHMVERNEGGALVAITSLTAIQGAASVQHYSASKAGVGALVRGLAVELARYRVRANAVMPGWIATDLNRELQENEAFMKLTTSRTPVRRWGTPDDVGRVVLPLADPTNLFHTGDTIVADGAYSIF